MTNWKKSIFKDNTIHNMVWETHNDIWNKADHKIEDKSYLVIKTMCGLFYIPQMKSWKTMTTYYILTNMSDKQEIVN